MKPLVQFFVPGLAKPAGSKRGFPIKRKDGSLGVAMTHDNPKTKDWMADVRQHAAAAMAAHRTSLAEGPIAVEVTFFVLRPNGHFGSGKNGHLLKPSAPEYPTTKPDLTKLWRATEDSLTGIVWKDDAQVVWQHTRKAFVHASQVPGVKVEVFSL